MKLIELFSGHVPEVEWVKHGQMHLGTFEINKNSYIIQFIKMSPGDPINSVLSKELLTKNTWFFSFAAVIDGEPIDTDIGKGDAIPVFSTILQTLTQFIEKNNIDVLYLGCADNHAKLKSIYSKLIARYTKAHNWKIENSTTQTFFGDKKFVWILKKSKG